MESSQEFRVSKNGFHGTLYCPKQDRYPDKALIVFGGSDGNFDNTCKLARLFYAEGITTLALAFWNAPGLPDILAEIPVESIHRAASWLHENGWKKVGLWGISMGAEYALLAGSLLPDLISCVVSVSPMDAVSQGVSKKGKIRLLNTSLFSFQGDALSYFALNTWSLGRMLQRSLKAREFTMAFAYTAGRATAPEDSVISVEQIAGPVLLISAKEDAIWHSAEAGERIMARLDKCKFTYCHRHLCYEFGSHLMYPMKDRDGKAFRMERKHPEECWKAKVDSFQQTLRFLKDW